MRNWQFSLLVIENHLLINHGILSVVTYTLFGLLVTVPVVAQTNPIPILPSPEPIPESEPLPPEEDLFPAPASPQEKPDPATPEVPSRIRVEAFEVKGSTVFTPSELAEVLAPYRDRALTFVELLEAQQAITNLYIEQGYITSGAYIPSQSFEEGIVIVQVVEGKIETIAVEGLDRLNAGYVRRRLELGTKTPLNQQDLLEALRLLQLDPLIASLSAELTAGSRPGLNRLTVAVSEAEAFSARVTLDNQRSPVVGTDRRLLEVSHNNLFGFGDRATFRYFNTDGSHSLDNLSYRIPLNGKNGTLSFSYRLTDNEIIEEPFNELDIDSDYRQYTLTYRVH